MSRFRNFSIFLVVSDSVSKKVSDSVLKISGIGKSIGFGIERIRYRKKVSDSVSFRFGVSSHTGAVRCTLYPLLFSVKSSVE